MPEMALDEEETKIVVNVGQPSTRSMQTIRKAHCVNPVWGDPKLDASLGRFQTELEALLRDVGAHNVVPIIPDLQPLGVDM